MGESEKQNSIGGFVEHKRKTNRQEKKANFVKAYIASYLWVVFKVSLNAHTSGHILYAQKKKQKPKLLHDIVRSWNERITCCNHQLE